MTQKDADSRLVQGELVQGEAVRRSRGEPRATYRVQLNAGFTFDDAAAVADYLRRLGVSHLYLSPVLAATPGSTHGYDVVDPTRVSPELGGAEGHQRLQVALGEAGIGQLVDIVPNHMAVSGRTNEWWWDVLENGPASLYATFFDVDWDPPESKLRNLVLLPVLGDHYGRELEAGHLRIEREGGGFVVRYFEHAAPLSPRSVDDLLLGAVGRLDAEEELEDHETIESIANAFGRLPPSIDIDAESVRERQRDKEVLRSRLADLLADSPGAAAAVDAEVAAINADVERLDVLLDRQNFRLAWWKTAGEELDYRRFFDINDLAAVRVEDPEVFAASNTLILEWLHGGVIDGLRIDHVDGLLDPEAYLERLVESAPDAWVVVEKVLEAGETLPETWPVAGTTGYDWLNLVAGLFDDPDGCEELAGIYREWTGVAERYEEIVLRAKQEILEGPLAADLRRMAGAFAEICESHRRYRDYTRRDLSLTLSEVLAGFAVYRTYSRAGEPARDVDVEVVENAVLGASIRNPDLDNELLGFLRDILLLRIPGQPELDLALRFQQVSGPVMAKAVEDTAFYRYVPLSWRNEVGRDPGRRVPDAGGFVASLQEAHAVHPRALLATSTHDTKRSEDVRARLAVLAEIPAEWEATVERWRVANVARATVASPDRSTEWLLYQTVVGAWPIEPERVVAYMEKATREAKVHTSWTQPDEYYDTQLRRFVEEMLGDADLVRDIDAFVEQIRVPGWTVSLGQKLLTLTAPGVADLYQGSELWDYSLVDPDNRRPVDYPLRQRLLETVEQCSAADLWAKEDGEGAAKLAVVRAALALRAEHPEFFASGDPGAVTELSVSGPAALHLAGFVRGSAVASLVTRLPVGLQRGGGWRDTRLELPAGEWLDRLSGLSWSGSVSVADVLAAMPLALLVRS